MRARRAAQPTRNPHREARRRTGGPAQRPWPDRTSGWSSPSAGRRGARSGPSARRRTWSTIGCADPSRSPFVRESGSPVARRSPGGHPRGAARHRLPLPSIVPRAPSRGVADTSSHGTLGRRRLGLAADQLENRTTTEAYGARIREPSIRCPRRTVRAPSSVPGPVVNEACRSLVAGELGVSSTRVDRQQPRRFFADRLRIMRQRPVEEDESPAPASTTAHPL